MTASTLRGGPTRPGFLSIQVLNLDSVKTEQPTNLENRDMTESKLNQTRCERKYGPVAIAGYGKGATFTATVAYDDTCRNGHNTFSITGEVRVPGRRRDPVVACGMMHDAMQECFPELAPFLRWHLVSADEPMYYIENTLYWLGYQGWCDGKDRSPPNLEHARSTAVWPDMPETLVCPADVRSAGNAHSPGADKVVAALEARRAQLMADFRAAVESLGFTF